MYTLRETVHLAMSQSAKLLIVLTSVRPTLITSFDHELVQVRIVHCRTDVHEHKPQYTD